MLVIKFIYGRELDIVNPDTGYFAVNSEGFIAMKAIDNVYPPPDAFMNVPRLLGIAKLSDKKLLYPFEIITPEFVNSGIQGLGPFSYSQPIYTIIVDDLGRKTSWSRGIEWINYPSY